MGEPEAPKHYILDEHNAVIETDLPTWAGWFERAENRMLAQWRTSNPSASDPGGHILVSTVFLGLDHNWGDGPPILWETMVFAPGWDFDAEQWRYASEGDARAGHAAAIQLVIDALEDGKQ